MVSKRFKWNKEDTIKFAKDTFKVLAPYILVIIPVLIGEIPSDWAYASISLFILHRIRAAAELFVAGKK
jgi:hypothetical protein